MTATAWPPRQHDDGITAAPWMSAKPFPCRENPELFFSEDPDDIAEAKSLCGFCPGRGACLRYALEERMQYGTWGGQSADERRGSTPGTFICSSCEQEKKNDLRRGKWCAACHKRWRLAGRPASGPPPPKTDAAQGAAGRAARNANQAAAAEARMKRYAKLRAAGVGNVEASNKIGVSPATGKAYAARLKDLPAPADHPWRQGDAVRPNREVAA